MVASLICAYFGCLYFLMLLCDLFGNDAVRYINVELWCMCRRAVSCVVVQCHVSYLLLIIVGVYIVHILTINNV